MWLKVTGKMRRMGNSLTTLGRKVEAARLARGWSKEYAAREVEISSIIWKRVEDGLGVQDTKRAAVLRTLGLDDRGDPIDQSAAPLAQPSELDVLLGSIPAEQLAIALLRRTGQVTPTQQARREADAAGEDSQDPADGGPA